MGVFLLENEHFWLKKWFLWALDLPLKEEKVSGLPPGSFLAASSLQLSWCIRYCKIIYVSQSPQAEASDTQYVL